MAQAQTTTLKDLIARKWADLQSESRDSASITHAEFSNAMCEAYIQSTGDGLSAQVDELVRAATELLEQCEYADNEDELCGYIEGDTMHALRTALSAFDTESSQP